MSAILRVNNLSRRFGSFWAVHDVSFSVSGGIARASSDPTAPAKARCTI